MVSSKATAETWNLRIMAAPETVRDVGGNRGEYR